MQDYEAGDENGETLGQRRSVCDWVPNDPVSFFENAERILEVVETWM